MPVAGAAAALLWVGACVQTRLEPCADDQHCARWGAVCNPVTHVCWRPPVLDAALGCSRSVDCADPARPVCSDGVCRPCQEGDDALCAARAAASPRCNLATGGCVECRPASQAIDCTGPRPICTADGSCRRCQGHAECPSLVCNLDGSCAPATAIVYVSNLMPCSASPAGTLADPFCEIQPALAALGGRSVVRVLGNAARVYAAASVMGLQVSLIGPGGRANPPAVIQAQDNHGVAVAGNAAVTVDGLEIKEALGVHDGITCSTTGTATLVLRRSYIHNNNRYGVSASNCSARLDANFITDNRGGGVVLTNSVGYQLENCILVRNGPIGRAVTINVGSSGGVRFNTIANNAIAPPGAGAIACNASTLIENSIIWMNSKDPATMSQLTGACMLAGVDIDQFWPSGTVNLPPDFTSDFHLDGRTAHNLDCCIDKIENATVDHDIDFTPRPQNVKWDLGAHEVRY